MKTSNLDVRFTPKSGHREARSECLLSAKSGHSRTELLVLVFAVWCWVVN